MNTKTLKDLFLPLACTNCPGHALLGMGGGTFAPPSLILGLSRAHGCVAVDVTTDGLPDVVVTENGNGFGLGSGLRIARSLSGGGFLAGPCRSCGAHEATARRNGG